MTFINLTPHEVTLFAESGEQIVLPPAENPARVRMADSTVAVHDGIVVKGQPTPVGLENLPEERFATLYIVSRIVKDAVQHRRDVVVPHDIVRDAKGVIVGCRSVAL